MVHIQNEIVQNSGALFKFNAILIWASMTLWQAVTDYDMGILLHQKRKEESKKKKLTFSCNKMVNEIQFNSIEFKIVDL